MKKICLIILLIFVAIFISCHSSKKDTIYITNHHGYGSRYSDILKKIVDKEQICSSCEIKSEDTEGSKDNLSFVDSTRNSFSISQADVFDEYKNIYANVRIVCTLYNEKLHLVYLADNQYGQFKIDTNTVNNAIHFFENYNSGKSNSGTKFTMDYVINAFGKIWKEKLDSNAIDVTPDVGMDKLKSQNIKLNAFVASGSNTIIKKATENWPEKNRVRLIEIDSNVIKKHLPRYLIDTTKIEGNFRITTIGTPALLVTNINTDTEYINRVVQTLNKEKSKIPELEEVEWFENMMSKSDDFLLMRKGLYTIYFVVAWFLSIIWFRSWQQKKGNIKDWGVFLIALYVLSIALINVVKDLEKLELASYALSGKVLSIFGYAFLVAALPYFTHAFNEIKEKYEFYKTGTTWASYVGLAAIIVITPVIILNENENGNELFIQILDGVFGVIVYSLFCYAIGKSFYNREYGRTFILTLIVIWVGLMITSVVFILDISPTPLLISIYFISQNTFLILLLVLVQSWVEEEGINREKLSIEQVHADSDKDIEEILQKVEGLTPKEKEVLRALAEESTYKAIGKDLRIADATVKAHISSIKKTLQVKGKSKLIEIAKKYVEENQ